MTILVTGATGNIGSRVVKELTQRGAAVRAFVCDAERAAALLGDGVEVAIGDFAEPASLRRALAGAACSARTCPARSTARTAPSTPPRTPASSASSRSPPP
jgi:nucleoside-diphosphate-sugar epimerase